MVVAIAKRTAFYALVAVIILVAVFPFYYAILTSLKSGTALFRIDYWPTDISLANYADIFSHGTFVRNLGNSLLVATLVVAISLLLAVTAAYALARVRFRGRGLLLLTILSVSMFPQIAVLAGLFELIRFVGIFNTPLALIFSYMWLLVPIQGKINEFFQDFDQYPYQPGSTLNASGISYTWLQQQAALKRLGALEGLAPR